jgi:hypothetical protein
MEARQTGQGRKAAAISGYLYVCRVPRQPAELFLIV